MATFNGIIYTSVDIWGERRGEKIGMMFCGTYEGEKIQVPRQFPLEVIWTRDLNKEGDD